LKKTIKVLAMDKKKSAGKISYVLLQKIGKPVIYSLNLDQIQKKLAEQ
jgi:3-dehydroquinate synthetase